VSALEVSCPTCATRLLLPPDNTATRFRCTQCGTVFDLAVAAAPAPEPPPPEAEPVLPEFAPLPVPVLVLPDAPPRGRRGRDDDDDRDYDRSRRGRRRRAEVDEEEPKRPAYGRDKPKGNTGLWVAILACVGALVVVGGVVAAYYGLRDKPKEPVKADPPPGTPTGKGPNRPPPVLTPEQAIRKVKTSTVYVRTFGREGSYGSGSGFFTGNKPGFVVTNAHVVGYGPRELTVPVRIDVVIDSGERTERTAAATVYGLDVDLDLALLKVDGKEMPPPLTLGKSEELSETQEVIVFGYPFGELLGKNVSVNRTTVSSLRKVNGSMDVVQLAGGLNPGNSGGPVANAKGEVIGVSVAKLRGTDTIAFAIPAEKTDRFVDDQFARGGYVRLGALAPFSTADLEGTYLMIGLESRSQKMTEEQLRGVPENQRKIVIRGDQMIVSTKDGVDTSTIRLDAAKSPQRIDIITTKEGRTEVNYGIFKVEGAVLTICASETGESKDRPREFKTDARSMMLVLRKLSEP
jgi:uncharacterized protein (TIGR03067 family)